MKLLREGTICGCTVLMLFNATFTIMIYLIVVITTELLIDVTNNELLTIVTNNELSNHRYQQCIL